MPLSFPTVGNSTEIVGQTPWSARVPLDPPVANEFSSVQTEQADEGVARRRVGCRHCVQQPGGLPHFECWSMKDSGAARFA